MFAVARARVVGEQARFGEGAGLTIGGKEAVDLRPGRGRRLVVGDLAHDPVAHFTPGESLRRASHGKRAKDQREFHAITLLLAPDIRARVWRIDGSAVANLTVWGQAVAKRPRVPSTR